MEPSQMSTLGLVPVPSDLFSFSEATYFPLPDSELGLYLPSFSDLIQTALEKLGSGTMEFYSGDMAQHLSQVGSPTASTSNASVDLEGPSYLHYLSDREPEDMFGPSRTEGSDLFDDTIGNFDGASTGTRGSSFVEQKDSDIDRREDERPFRIMHLHSLSPSPFSTDALLQEDFLYPDPDEERLQILDLFMEGFQQEQALDLEVRGYTTPAPIKTEPDADVDLTCDEPPEDTNDILPLAHSLISPTPGDNCTVQQQPFWRIIRRAPSVYSEPEPPLPKKVNPLKRKRETSPTPATRSTSVVPEKKKTRTTKKIAPLCSPEVHSDSPAPSESRLSDNGSEYIPSRSASPCQPPPARVTKKRKRPEPSLEETSPEPKRKVRKTKSGKAEAVKRPKGKFPCDYPGCGRRFSRKYDVNRHSASIHEGGRHECEICGTTLSR